MTIVPDQPKIVAAAGEKLRFKWAEDGDEPIESSFGKRHMNISPMCSDGKYIYAMVFHHEDGPDTPKKCIFIEKYLLVDNAISFISEIQLNKNNSPYKPNNAQMTDEGGYLDHGSCASNGLYFVWHSRKHIHLFDLKTGDQLKKVKVHGNSNHLSMYDHSSSNWFTCDAAVYSWLDRWTIKGFKTIIQTDEDEEEGEAKLPAIPTILDEPKNKIKKNAPKSKQPSYQLNMFPQFIGGQLEIEAKK